MKYEKKAGRADLYHSFTLFTDRNRAIPISGTRTQGATDNTLTIEKQEGRAKGAENRKNGLREKPQSSMEKKRERRTRTEEEQRQTSQQLE